MNEWEQKILSKVPPEKRHGSTFLVVAKYQDEGYVRIVAESIKLQQTKPE